MEEKGNRMKCERVRRRERKKKIPEKLLLRGFYSQSVARVNYQRENSAKESLADFLFVVLDDGVLDLHAFSGGPH